MDFRFSAEDEKFRQEVRDFCERELPPDWMMGEFFAEEGLETEEEWVFYHQFKRKMGARGWLSIGWPKQYGGQASRMKFAILEDEINYYGAPGLDASLTYGIVTPTLIGHCNEEQKKKHLPPLARGEVIWCEGFSEPNAGSDVAVLISRAVKEGDYFVANGQKTWSSLGHHADWGIFLFRTDPNVPRHKGISMFLVDMTSPGITRNPIKNRLSHATWCETFLDNVKIPQENLVGELGQGWEITMNTLNNERSGMQWLSTSRRGLHRIIKYVKERPNLAKNPIIRHKVANLAIEVELSRLFCYYIEYLRAQGKTPIHEASMVKVFSADLSVRVADTCFEIMGLHGQLARGSKWAPLSGTIMEAYLGFSPWTMAGGSPEIQKNVIATMGLRLPR